MWLHVKAQLSHEAIASSSRCATFAFHVKAGERGVFPPHYYKARSNAPYTCMQQREQKEERYVTEREREKGEKKKKKGIVFLPTQTRTEREKEEGEEKRKEREEWAVIVASSAMWCDALKIN